MWRELDMAMAQGHDLASGGTVDTLNENFGGEN